MLRLQGTLVDVVSAYSCNGYGWRLIQLVSDHTSKQYNKECFFKVCAVWVYVHICTYIHRRADVCVCVFSLCVLWTVGLHKRVISHVYTCTLCAPSIVPPVSSSSITKRGVHVCVLCLSSFSMSQHQIFLEESKSMRVYCMIRMRHCS